MRHKSYSSIPGAGVIPLSCLLASLAYSCLLAFCIYDKQMSPFLLCGCTLFIIGGIYMAVYSAPYALCSFEIYDCHILCKIPFHRNYKIVYEKCSIGMDYHIQSGRKVWWIYLCYGNKPPYKPKNPANRINAIKCEPGFIRIMYREDVYKALLDILPKQQKTALISAHRCAEIEKQGKRIP